MQPLSLLGTDGHRHSSMVVMPCFSHCLAELRALFKLPHQSAPSAFPSHVLLFSDALLPAVTAFGRSLCSQE